MQSEARLLGREHSCGIGASLDRQQAAFSGVTFDLGRAGCCPSIPLCIGCSLHSVPGKAPGAQGPTCAGHAGGRMTVALAMHHDSARCAVSVQALNWGQARSK